MGIIPMLLDRQRERENARLLMQMHLREEQEQRQRLQKKASGLMTDERFRRALENPYEKQSGPGSNDSSMLPSVEPSFAGTVAQADPENAVVPLPPTSMMMNDQDSQVSLLQRIRDRMSQTRGRLAAGGRFVRRNVVNPFKEYPMLANRIEGLNVEPEEAPDRQYLPPQSRPRYI